MVVVSLVADGEVLSAVEDEVASALAEHDRTDEPGRPDDRTVEDLAQMVEQQVTAMLGGLDDAPVLLGP